MSLSTSLRTAIALALGGVLAWLLDELGHYPEFSLRDCFPPLCAASLAVAWNRKLHDASQGILLCFVAGIGVSIFAALGENLLFLTPLPIPLLVFLPDFLSVLLFLLVCSYFVLRPGSLPMLAGAAVAGGIRLVLWTINVLTLPEPWVPYGIQPWAWMGGVAFALLVWPRGTESPAGLKWVEDPKED
jgi:hypothetical protein